MATLVPVVAATTGPRVAPCCHGDCRTTSALRPRWSPRSRGCRRKEYPDLLFRLGARDTKEPVGTSPCSGTPRRWRLTGGPAHWQARFWRRLRVVYHWHQQPTAVRSHPPSTRSAVEVVIASDQQPAGLSPRWLCVCVCVSRWLFSRPQRLLVRNVPYRCSQNVWQASSSKLCRAFDSPPPACCSTPLPDMNQASIKNAAGAAGVDG